MIDTWNYDASLDGDTLTLETLEKISSATAQGMAVYVIGDPVTARILAIVACDPATGGMPLVISNERDTEDSGAFA